MFSLIALFLSLAQLSGQQGLHRPLWSDAKDPLLSGSTRTAMGDFTGDGCGDYLAVSSTRLVVFDGKDGHAVYDVSSSEERGLTYALADTTDDGSSISSWAICVF